ncbi:PREDICTED: uncharacterized protein LOC106805826 isoform X2 [Priapulus caudatus]|uniref:Uncharacterized protein LOC106805826 isoform X2 n=1 Tax=Priapulus caudatus TaxID=37621 RepID=A0ABM1DSZ5_PRICU|nr:PREDICTED: uncharacterized protein LOC106805826 isoform X2 [Priapulus caudatus]
MASVRAVVTILVLTVLCMMADAQRASREDAVILGLRNRREARIYQRCDNETVICTEFEDAGSCSETCETGPGIQYQTRSCNCTLAVNEVDGTITFNPVPVDRLGRRQTRILDDNGCLFNDERELCENTLIRLIVCNDEVDCPEMTTPAEMSTTGELSTTAEVTTTEEMSATAEMSTTEEMPMPV